MEPPPPLPPSDAAAFLKLLESLPKKKISKTAKFVKRVEDIPEISLPPDGPIKVALSLAERALVGQFTGLWPSPKTTESWVARNWAPLIKDRVTSYFLGKGFFLFEFSDKDDKDLIFQNGPYFMGPQGLYLKKWTLDFDPTVDVPTTVPVWVRLPNLPVHCWNGESLKHIGNTLGKYIDRASNKDQYDCARICVEVELEIGLPEAVKIRVGSWTHLQKLDYEQLPFKCRKCHVYGHFARSCPKNCEAEKGKEEGWTQVKRSKNAHRAPCTGNTNGNGSQAAPRIQTPNMEEQGNKFVQLSSVIEGSQELEKQKDDSIPIESPSGPKHVDSNEDRSKDVLIEETKEGQDSDDSEEEGEIGISQTSARRSLRGRKSAREKREQETYKDKLQGSQPNLEKLLENTLKKNRNQSQSSRGAHHSKSK